MKKNKNPVSDVKVKDAKKAQKALTEKEAVKITNRAGKHKYK